MEHGITAAKFAKEAIPLCIGPIVTIRIGNMGYDVSKTILCRHSAYFAAMFNGRFVEGTDQSAKLEPVEGVVSQRSLEALLQWVYCGYVRLDDEVLYIERISAALEFLRFADMAGVAVDEARVTAQIREAMVREPIRTGSYHAEDAIKNVSAQHVHSASRLRRGHSVRVLFAQAVAAALVTSRSFKFQKEVEEIPEFGADVLRELVPLLVKASSGESCLGRGPALVELVDPFTQQRMAFDGRIKTPSNRGKALYDGYCRMSVG